VCRNGNRRRARRIQTLPIALSRYALVGVHDYRLVALSVLIAMLASYAAQDVGGRVTASRGLPRLFWVAGGSATMGLGIWAMHYIGMLAGPRCWCLFWRPCSRLELRCCGQPRENETIRHGNWGRAHGMLHRKHALHRHAGDALRGDALCSSSANATVPANSALDIDSAMHTHLVRKGRSDLG
jgi:hypothetical protein